MYTQINQLELGINLSILYKAKHLKIITVELNCIWVNFVPFLFHVSFTTPLLYANNILSSPTTTTNNDTIPWLLPCFWC